MTTEKLGPCPLCGGEAEYLGTCGVECSAEDCMMAVCSPVVWNRLSALAEQNRRRGEALERCRGKLAEYAKHHAGKVRAFDQVLSQESKDALKKYDSNIAMAKMCEEALKS